MRSNQGMAALAPVMRREVGAIDAQIPLEFEMLADRVAKSSAERRFPMLLLGAFAIVALVLAVVGIYAVVSYAVLQRTREIGVRLALGASRAEVRAMVLRSAMVAIVPGLAIGAIVALASSNFIRSLLYGVSPFDPVALGTAIILLAVAAVVSCAVPATRATRVDPLIAMRTE